MKSKNNQGVAIILVIGLIAAAGAAFYFSQKLKNSQSAPKLQNLAQEVTSILPQESPDPFAELTIPFLRKRQYKSELGELERITSNSDYTSYLTSYDSDGLNINGLLTIPQSEKPKDGFPAIVFVHGYIPPANYNTKTSYSSYVDYLARNGFVVFKIDLRGHADSEGLDTSGYFSGDYVIDTLNAHAALGAADFINPNRIGFWGHSMSGNIVMRALAAQPKAPAVVVWAGAVYSYEDFEELSISDTSYQPPPTDSPQRRYREELAETHGGFDPEDNFWQQVPVTNYLNLIEGAVQIHHALDDSVVNIEYSRDFIEQLENEGISAQLHEYPSGGHNLIEPAFTQAMQRTVEFFQREL